MCRASYTLSMAAHCACSRTGHKSVRATLEHRVQQQGFYCDNVQIFLLGVCWDDILVAVTTSVWLGGINSCTSVVRR